MAMQTHLEVQQREDIRRDVAASLNIIPPNMVHRGHRYYWQQDPNKFRQGKKTGNLVNTVILAVQGPMATISNGIPIMQVNVTRLRRPLHETDA